MNLHHVSFSSPGLIAVAYEGVETMWIRERKEGVFSLDCRKAIDKPALLLRAETQNSDSCWVHRATSYAFSCKILSKCDVPTVIQ